MKEKNHCSACQKPLKRYKWDNQFNCVWTAFGYQDIRCWFSTDCEQDLKRHEKLHE